MNKLTGLGVLAAAGLMLQACESSDNTAAQMEVLGPPPEDLSELAPAAGVGIEVVLEGEHRSAENRARDQFRHPKETLAFFGVEPDSSVIEIWPGGAWYTEILAPYLREDGRYIAAGFDPDSEIEFIRNGVVAFQSKLDASPELYDKVETTVLMPPSYLEMAPEGSVDFVLTFRSVHNWMARDIQGDILASVYAALKPGGVLGIVEHRGNPETTQDPKASTGYVNQDYVIAMVQAAGFVFDEISEINANPADVKEYPEGVWTLPPTLRLGEQDKDKYLAIGESDRFTLRFTKPVE
jgi:predicted methyltransferase